MKFRRYNAASGKKHQLCCIGQVLAAYKLQSPALTGMATSMWQRRTIKLPCECRCTQVRAVNIVATGFRVLYRPLKRACAIASRRFLRPSIRRSRLRQPERYRSSCTEPPLQ